MMITKLTKDHIERQKGIISEVNNNSTMHNIQQEKTFKSFSSIKIRDIYYTYLTKKKFSIERGYLNILKYKI